MLLSVSLLPVDEATSSGQYDLKKSSASIGQLYRVLLAKDGEILDGFHRKNSDRSWRTVTLTHIDTPEKKLTARLVANFHRRQVSTDEKVDWMNRLSPRGLLDIDDPRFVVRWRHSNPLLFPQRIRKQFMVIRQKYPEDKILYSPPASKWLKEVDTLRQFLLDWLPTQRSGFND